MPDTALATQRGLHHSDDPVANGVLDACLNGLGLARPDAGCEVSVAGCEPVIDSPHRLAVASERRLSLLPDVRTAHEAGISGYVASTWVAAVVPSKAPKAVQSRLGDWMTGDRQRTGNPCLL